MSKGNRVDDMANSKYSLSEAQIAKRIKKGRGSGSGADYSPWVRVDEVPSLGRSRQVYSPPANNAVDMVMFSDLLVDSTDKSEPIRITLVMLALSRR